MADYTYEEVMAALRNADAAGDTEAATRLASIAASMQTQPKEAAPQKEEQPKESSFGSELLRQVGLTARGAITGAMSIPTAAADILNAGVNVGLEAVGAKPLMPASQALQQGMTQVGIPEPQNQLERAVQAGVGAMSGVGAEAAAAKALAPNLLKPMTQNLGTQTAAAAAAAPAAQVVGEAVQEKTENPIASIAAGLAAGVLAGGAAAKALKMGEKVPSPVTIDDVKKQAAEAYTQVKNSGVQIKPLSALGVVNNVKKNLEDNLNFNPDLDTHRPLQQTINKAIRMIGTERVDMSKVEQIRQSFNDLTVGGDPATRKLAKEAVQTIDESLGNITPSDVIRGAENTKDTLDTLKTARSKWRVAAKAQVLQDILDTAETKALNPKQTENEIIRTNIINLLANKSKRSVFSSDEQAALKKVANSGTSDVLLSVIANLNPEKSRFMTIATGAGLASAPTVAVPAAAAGYAADYLQSAIRRKQLEGVTSGLLTGNMPAAGNVGIGRAAIESLKQQ